MPSPEPKQAVFFNNILETLGIWTPILVVLMFLDDPHFPDVFMDAYGSGSLAATAAIIALALLTVSSGRFLLSISIAMFVVLMFLLQERVLAHYVYGAPTAPATASGDQADLFRKVPNEIWVTFVSFLTVASVRTMVLRRQSSSFDENQ